MTICLCGRKFWEHTTWNKGRVVMKEAFMPKDDTRFTANESKPQNENGA